MKRILAISLSLAMVFAIFGAMTVSVSAEEEYVTKTLYSFEDGDGGTGPTIDGIKYQAVNQSVNWALATTQKHGGEKSLSTTPIKPTWNLADNGKEKNVTSDNLKSYIVFPIPTNLKVTGDVGFWLYFTARNNSNFSAYGVQTENGDMYFTKFKMYPVSWTNCKITGITLYKYNDSSTQITLNADNYANYKIKSIVFVDGGTADTKSPAYIDDIYYQTTEAPSDPTIEMASGAAMRIDGTTNGIRFEASVDKSAFVAIKDKTNIEIGTLIAKYGTKLDDVVVNNATEVTSSGQNIGNKIPVAKYASTTTMADIEGTDKYVIYGSLVGIDDGNATQKYVARAYVKYTDESGEHVLYAKDLSEPRSLAEVAYKLKNDTAVPEGMSGTYYNSLCQTHKDYVDGLAKQYVE